MDEPLAWYNFKTDSTDYLIRPKEGEYKNYIPQSPPALDLFNLLVNRMDYSEQEALRYVLSICVGISPE